MTGRVGAMNSLIVRPTRSIFSLFLGLYKERECPPVNRRVSTKPSCLVTIKQKNSETPSATAARLHDLSYPFTKNGPYGQKSHSDETFLFFYI